LTQEAKTELHHTPGGWSGMSRVAARLCQERAATDGLGSNKNAIKYLKQDYEVLKQQCLQAGTLFKDEEFPACPSALGYQDLGPYSFKTQGIVWKRPTELCANPQFIIGGATRTDVCQGKLGDCWLLAAIASLTLNPDILYRVVPKAQSFQKDYAGIFHFQFWQYGEWVDVVVDDRLPTRNGELLFVHSEERNEFWSALLEKAYAKLNGSYEALTGGSTMEGFEDFTGGISESYELRRAPSDLYQIIQKALRAGSLLGCSIDITTAAEIEAMTSLQLVKGHAYSVTGAEEVYYRGRPEKLVRLRNPWGKCEWTGAWSDNASEWNYVDPKQKQALDKKVDDGEFWMAFSDFQRQFTRLEICNLTPDTLTRNEVNKWDLTLFNGQWRRGSSAGGCQNYQATYWTNPQFKIRLDEPDYDHEGSLDEPCCTILVGLMQKNRRRQKKMGEALLSIGYSLYQIPQELENNTDVHVNRAFFARNKPAARSDPYVNLREVSRRMKLPRGEYLIVPSTFEPYKNGEFCLRVFSEKQAKTQCVSFLDGFNINTCREMISLLDVSFECHFITFKVSGSPLQNFPMRWTKFALPLSRHMAGGIKFNQAVLSAQGGRNLNHLIIGCFSNLKLTIDFDGFVACMIHLETLFSKCLCSEAKGNSENFGISLSICYIHSI
uniref:Calpain 8 n=1 Tax=Otus sunia TaxID=257818 RepID=A0A8C8AP71_9STRI